MKLNMNVGDKALHVSFFNVEIVCHVWDGALWDVSDGICMMTR